MVEVGCIRVPAEGEGDMGNGNRGRVSEEEEGSIAHVADEALGRGKGIVAAVHIMDVHPGMVMGKVEVTR